MGDSKALTKVGATQLGELGVQDMIARKTKLVEVMNAVMKEGEHYGRIPGCGNKPTLFKSGAEVLATTFGLAPKFTITRNDLHGGHREYEITCTLVHIATGAIVGEGVGCCSTMESKYRWRRGERKCPHCDQPTIMRSKYNDGWFCFAKKGGCGAEFYPGDRSIEDQDPNRMENPDIADSYNTVLKMAKKRAQVDATLTATGASDILAQDLEDLQAQAQDQGDDWGVPNAIQGAIDADYRDVPHPGNGRGEPPRDERRRPPQQDERPPSNGSRGTGISPRELELLAAIDDGQSRDDVQRLVPELMKQPEDSKRRLRKAYDAKMRSFNGQRAAGGGR